MSGLSLCSLSLSLCSFSLLSPEQGWSTSFSMQNWGHGNDMSAASMMVPDADAKAAADAGHWTGGVNVTAIRTFFTQHSGSIGTQNSENPTGIPCDAGF